MTQAKDKKVNYVIFSMREESADMRITINPEKLLPKIIADGGSIITVYADYKENLYRMLIVYNLSQDAVHLLELANDLFPIYVEDVGQEQLKDCIVPDSFVSRMKGLL